MEILGEMSHEYLDRWRHAISARRLVRPGALESALIRCRKHRHTGVGIRLQRGGSPTNGAGRAVRFRLTRCKTFAGIRSVLRLRELLGRGIAEKRTRRRC